MRNKAFTLIELLAVIIILGILMLIAIPSVTNYINNSRKESYISTIKEIVRGATNLVNSGELDMYDPNNTYYIPTSCIKTENNVQRSPYGNLNQAYVVVSLNNDDYNYFFVGKDEENIGVASIISSDVINKDSITTNINNIDTTVGIKGTSNTIVYNNDCSEIASINPVTKTIDGNNPTPKICPDTYTSIIYWALQDNDEDGINEKLVLSNNEVDGNKKGSFNGNYEFHSDYDVPWITRDNFSNKVSIVTIEGKIVPTSTKAWFYKVGVDATTFTADLSNLDTCLTTNMNRTFGYAGNNAQTISLIGLENFDTSLVTDMNELFNKCGENASSFVIDLSNWNTSNVTDMYMLFHYAGKMSTEWSIGDISNWDTSKVTTMGALFSGAGYSVNKFNLDLSKWNTSNVTNMLQMFWTAGFNATEFSIGDISNWDTRKVTNMNYTFSNTAKNCNNFNLNISKWNFSNVTDINTMFYYNGPSSNHRTIIIPPTNGNGISNTTTTIYGKDSTVNTSTTNPSTFTISN